MRMLLLATALQIKKTSLIEQGTTCCCHTFTYQSGCAQICSTTQYTLRPQVYSTPQPVMSGLRTRAAVSAVKMALGTILALKVFMHHTSMLLTILT